MVHVGQGFAELGDLPACMQNGRVVAPAEVAPDLGQGHLCEFLGQRHGDLPWPRHGARAFLGMHVGNADLVVIGNGLLDVVDGDLAILNGEQVAQSLLGQRQVTARERFLECMSEMRIL